MPAPIRVPSVGLLAPLAIALAAGCRDASGPTTAESMRELAAAATAPLTFRQVSEGDAFSCGTTTGDVAYCWGGSTTGALGNGTSDDISPTPVAVAGGLRFRQVEAGVGHACGITTDDRAYCWGGNQYGQLGDGSGDNRNVPGAVVGNHRFRQISAGQFHTCAITTTNDAYCWGRNVEGQAGTGADAIRYRRPVKVSLARKFQIVSAGARHSCGVTTAHKALCWGAGGSGQLGNNGTGGKRTPVAVAGGLSFLNVSAGDQATRGSGYYSCGVATDNRAYCWGDNLDGQLGDGTTTRRLKPTAVAGAISFGNISAGTDHTCGVSTTNVGYCWGYNYYGALGDGGPLGDQADVHRTPFAVVGGHAFKRVTGGRTHSCGVTTTGAAYCWGGNTGGQLGDGTTSFASSTPGPVVGPN